MANYGLQVYSVERVSNVKSIPSIILYAIYQDVYPRDHYTQQLTKDFIMTNIFMCYVSHSTRSYS